MKEYFKKLNSKVVLSTLLVSLLFAATPSRADIITLKADNWCPYNCDPTDVNPGYMVEIAKEIFGKHGHIINYELLNWSSAISQAREGKIDGIIGASPGDAEDFAYPESNMGYLENVFITLKDNDANYSGDMSSLKGHVFGVIKDYDYGSKIVSYVNQCCWRCC